MYMQATGTRRDVFELALGLEPEHPSVPQPAPEPEKETQAQPQSSNAFIGNRGTVRGVPGRPVLSRKPFNTQLFPSSGSMSAVSHTHMVFDFEYLFRLSYCYIFRFIDANKILDMESVTNLASLVHLTPKVRVASLKVDGVDANTTAEYVTSYKLLMGALHSVSAVTKTKIPAKFHRLAETQKIAVEALNIAFARRGDGMAKAVVPPRGSRVDIHVRFFPLFSSFFFFF